MEIRKCTRCGRFFQTVRSPHCGACQDEIDRECRKIRNHLVTHPDANAAGIAAALEIDERTILQLLRDGRLELKEQPDVLCQGCGQPSRSGRFCQACISRLANGLGKGAADDRAGSQSAAGKVARLPGGTAAKAPDAPVRMPDRPNAAGHSEAGGTQSEKPRERGMHVKRKT